MKTRIFGKTNAVVSEVGLGCWQFGGDWGSVTNDECLATLNTAADAGVTFIDTADVYGAGHSEEMVGRFLKDRNRDDFFVATKLGRLHGYPDSYSLDLFRSDTEASLKRLDINQVDLTQTHCVPPSYMEAGEVYEWLETIRQDGLIKHWGASVESMDEALTCLQYDGLASLQVIFNVFRQKPIDVLFEKAKEKNVAIIARVPLASGLLAGKFNAQTTFAEKDHRNYNRDGDFFNAGETFAGLPFSLGVELAEELKVHVPEGLAMAQWALRWVLDFDAVSVVIPGAKDPQQALANAAASDAAAINTDTHAAIKQLYEAKIHDAIRGVY
jgi:aryl-alcohol dehydrogenase-like predicted oxidoreductase